MKIKLPHGCTRDPGHDGKERIYYRVKGQPKIRINGVPWTPGFMAEYQAASQGVVYKQPLAPKQTGTFAWLCEQYFSSAEFKALDPTLTKPRRTDYLNRICREPVKPGSTMLFGNVPLHAWNKQAVRALRDRVAETPGTANNLLKSLRTVFKFGNEAGHCETDPARDVAYLSGSVDGHHSWTIEEVEKYESKWPVGTKERLAMGLVLFMGQRASDAYRVGPKNIKLVPTEMEDGTTAIKKWLVFTQWKNRNIGPIHMEIPMRPELEELIAATPTGTETFLTTPRGKPFKRSNNFADWFAKGCIAAGVPGRSHGLRKACAARLAELGASEKEIMAITGHTTMQEVVRYTKAASNKILAAKAIARSAKVK